ncbi:MAG: hypothetical protein E7643_04610 [Ruminococcaceae bacterium]|nr:hypothetical protein [Oscillospiraceae bacterium]
MEKIITYDTLRSFAYSNDKLIKGEIRGIVLHFSGLSFKDMIDSDPSDAKEYAEKGIVYIVPYFNPWCWMNKSAVALIDEIIDVVCTHYAIVSPRIVSSGVSMGGLCALVYCAYAKNTPVSCVANCPVCDLPYHFTERPDLPRTLYSAFFEYDGTMEEALCSASPVHLAPRMPQISYTIFHCEHDLAVNIQKHSERFVEAMRPYGEVTLIRVPLRSHGDLSAEARVRYRETILSAFQ